MGSGRRSRLQQVARVAASRVTDATVGSAFARRRGRRFGRRLQAPGAEAAAPIGRLEALFDAQTTGPGVWKWRHYFPVYERHLGRFVGTECVVVEIGVFSGGSLRLWRSYFGDDAHLHGVDIEPACAAYAAERTTIHIGDQADPAFWSRFVAEVPEIDVVLDDGGHQLDQQVATIEALLPHLRPGGVYLCEDIHRAGNPFHAYVHGLSLGLHASNPRPSALQRAVDSVHVYPFVAVVERRAHRLDALEAPKHGTQWQPFYSRESFARDEAADQTPDPGRMR